jgi:hypothetical protein
MTNLKNNNKQWNNKTERYKISNTDEMYPKFVCIVTLYQLIINKYVYTNSSFCTRCQYSPFYVAISAQLHKEMFIISYIHYIQQFSWITKQKDIKLVIQMKCTLELWCKSLAFKNKILYLDKNVYILIPSKPSFRMYIIFLWSGLLHFRRQDEVDISWILRKFPV